jgi:hypothetical protein
LFHPSFCGHRRLWRDSDFYFAHQWRFGAGKTLPASFLFIAIAATSLLHTVERWAEKRGGIVDRLKNHQNAGHLLLGIVCGILFTLTYLKLSFTAPRSDFIYFRF